MNDQEGTGKDLQEELGRLRRRIAELESRGTYGGSTEKELRESLLRQNAILNNIPDIAWLKDRESRFIAANGPFGSACGRDPELLVGKTDLDIWPKDLAESYRADDAEVMRTRKRKRVEERLVSPDSKEIWIETIKTPILDAQGAVIGTTGIARDITDRKRAEAKLLNVTRLYAFLSQINQAIVRIRDRDQLFQAICQVAIECGGFRMAWVGLVDDTTGIVRPVTRAGHDEGYLDLLTVRTGNVPEGKGPTGTALREGSLVICDDISTDPRMLPWRDEALRRGYRSSAAIPFRMKEKVIGSLNLYASEPGFFAEDERKLLTEIGIDITYALDNIERESERKRAEEALRESRERFRSFFENAAVAVALVDPDGRVVEANDADCRFLGYSREELIGMHFSQFTHPEDLATDAALYRSLLNGERTGYEIEKRYLRKDGGVVWGRLAIALIHDSAGAVKYTSVVCYDITDRKRAEEALRQSEQRYRTLFDTMAQGVVYQARDGRIISANPAAERILGVSIDQMEGRTSLDPRWRTIHEDGSEFPGDRHPAMEALRTGKPVHDTIMGVFHPGRNEYRWILVNAVPEFLPGETKPCQVYATFTDITERRKAEAALRESEEQYRAIFEGIGDAVFVHRPEKDAPTGRFIAVNDVACRHLGYTREELLSLTLPQVDPLDDAVIPSVLESLNAGREAFFETVHIRKDGRRVPVEVRAKTIRYLGAPAVLSVARDITDRKRAEEELRSRTRGLAALLEVSRGLAETLDLGTVLQATTDGITKLFGAGTAAVYLLEGETLRLGATTPPLPGTFPEELRFAPLADHPHIREAIASGKPVLVPDMRTADLVAAERSVAEQRSLRTVLFLPLIAGVKPEGTLIVGSVAETRAISEAEIDLCRTLANLAALAVENALLFTAGRRHAADLEQQIAERRQAEEALRKSEEKYRTLFDSATDAVFILDLEGNILDVNRTAHARLGYTKQELLSMHITRLDPPEFAARVPERLAEIARYGAAVFESAHFRKDGSVMPVEVNSRLLDHEGRQVYFSIIRDITERKQMEEALRESEEKFRSVFDSASDGILLVDPQTKQFVIGNATIAWMLGVEQDDLPRMTVADIHPPAALQDVVKAFEKVMRGEAFFTENIPVLRKDGSVFFADIATSWITVKGTHYMAGFFRDITERKRAEQDRLELERRLLHSQKLESLGILAGGIAHDFNNLLMAVLGNLDLALRKVSPVSPARTNLEQSAQAARRATDLTRQMLAYSGKGRFIVKAMDLSELVEENTHLLRSSVARTAALDVRLGRSLPLIEADAGQVQQVIMNLITNASEAIGDASGTITIATGVQECDAQCLKRSRIEEQPPAGRFVFLEVADTGCGMDEQTQQRLFDPFFTTKAPGRGLGMSAILGIVRGHRGAIFVESGPGRGTSIRILFPALEEASAERAMGAGAAAAEAEKPGVSGTVLVVDDEEIVRTVCAEMVESLGLPVLTAVDGRDAIDVFSMHAGRISHVILDLSMPNMDGMAAFAELERIKPGVKIIMSSGYDEQESLQRMSGRGLAGFIQKPYSLKNLRDALDKA